MGSTITSPHFTFYDAAQLAFQEIELPRRYRLDDDWPNRAKRIPYTNMGGIEWRADGFRPVDFMSGAQRGTFGWPSWWSQSMPAAFPTPPPEIVEAWFEQDAPEPESHGDPKTGFFWGVGSAASPGALQLAQLARTYPAFEGAVAQTERHLTRGLPISWLGIFPRRSGRPTLRLNLSRQHPSALEALFDDTPSFRSLYERVNARLDDNTSVAWCWDQTTEGPTRLTAELTAGQRIRGGHARREQLSRMLSSFGQDQLWLEDALVLNEAFHSVQWAIPPTDHRAVPFCADILLSPQNELPQIVRQLTHIKVELDPHDPSGPLSTKIYGMFGLPGSGRARNPLDPRTTPVWTELHEALAQQQQQQQQQRWPLTIEALQQAVPWWQGVDAATIRTDLQQRARFQLAHAIQAALKP